MKFSLALATFALVLGVTACSGGGSSPVVAPPAPAQVYAAFGASDVRGTGASVPCDTLACPGGTGWAPDLVGIGKGCGLNLVLSDYGVESTQLTVGLSQIITDQIPQMPADTAYATLGTASDLLAAALAHTDEKTTATLYANQLRTAINLVHARAPNARLVVIAYPDLSLTPWAQVNLDPAGRVLLSALMNDARIATLLLSDVAVADLWGAPNVNNPFVSVDGLHPNTAGYQDFARRVAPSMFPKSCVVPL